MQVNSIKSYLTQNQNPKASAKNKSFGATISSSEISDFSKCIEDLISTKKSNEVQGQIKNLAKDIKGIKTWDGKDPKVEISSVFDAYDHILGPVRYWARVFVQHPDVSKYEALESKGTKFAECEFDISSTGFSSLFKKFESSKGIAQNLVEAIQIATNKMNKPHKMAMNAENIAKAIEKADAN